jgi:hypothetical protein
LEIALIEVQFVFALVGRKEKIRKSVSIDITGGDTPSIVIVEVFNDVEGFGFLKGIIS